MNGLKQTVVGKADIVRGLRHLGVKAGDAILAHSSLKSFGRVEGGAEAVVDALLETVGPTGTAMVPTLTGRREDSAEDPPVFDVRQTPTWTGLIPETLRRRAGARRSLHPTHSAAAIGPQADFLIRDHLTCDTPCGPGSPYLRLADLDGKVVFLGVGLTCCTLLHGVEELAHAAYHMQPRPVRAVITDWDGRRLERKVRIHDWGAPRDFSALEPIFVKAGIMRLGKVGEAAIRVLAARPAVERALALLRESPRLLCQPAQGRVQVSGV